MHCELLYNTVFVQYYTILYAKLTLIFAVPLYTLALSLPGYTGAGFCTFGMCMCI